MITDKKWAVYDSYPTLVVVPADVPLVAYAKSDQAGLYSDFAYVVKVYVDGASVITYKLAADPEKDNGVSIDVSRFVRNYISLKLLYEDNYWVNPGRQVKVGFREFYSGSLQGSEVFTTTLIINRSVDDDAIYNTPAYLARINNDTTYLNKDHLTEIYERRYLNTDYFFDALHDVSASDIRIEYYDSGNTLLSTDVITAITSPTSTNIHNVMLHNLSLPLNTAYIMIVTTTGLVVDRRLDVVTPPCDEEWTYVHFLNKWGVLESVLFTFEKRYEIDASEIGYRSGNEKYDYVYNRIIKRGDISLSMRRRKRLQIKSGWISIDRYNRLLNALSRSPLLFVTVDGQLERCILRAISGRERKSADTDLHEMTITVDVAFNDYHYDF